MIEIHKITTKDEKDYSEMQSLMLSSFPKEERREINIQRDYADNNDLFFCNVVTDNNDFIGLINYWNLKHAYYIEHFAVCDKKRNRGYGKMVLDLIKQQLCNKPIVLEVEPPIDENSKRRIEFYRGNGFQLSPMKYIQPPYRKSENEFELKIMFYENFNKIENDIEIIVNEIHKEVYGK